MKKILFISAVVFSLIFSSQGFAVSYVLDFEGLQNLEPIANFYNGGTGGLGSGPGTNFGISFGSDALAIIDADAGGTGNFANEPSPDTIAFFRSGSIVMDVSGGFTDGFSFFYTNDDTLIGQVDVYDGLGATGNLLASLVLPLTGVGPGDPNGGVFGAWNPIGVNFLGVAKSVDFSGSADQIGFDNITLGSSTPGAIPEPTTLLLLGFGLISLAGFRWKFRK